MGAIRKIGSTSAIHHCTDKRTMGISRCFYHCLTSFCCIQRENHQGEFQCLRVNPTWFAAGWNGEQKQQRPTLRMKRWVWGFQFNSRISSQSSEDSKGGVCTASLSSWQSREEMAEKLCFPCEAASQGHLWLLCFQSEESSKSGHGRRIPSSGLEFFPGRGWW